MVESMGVPLRVAGWKVQWARTQRRAAESRSGGGGGDADAKTDGAGDAALTEAQRKLMRSARKKNLDAACWLAYSEANAFNNIYADEILQEELRGRHIVISLADQRGVFKDGEKVLLRFEVCTGRASKPTPTGYFHIMERDLHHRSNLYNSARMEFFQRLTNDGVGFHQGAMVGYPASHGCIRLSAKTAAFLWKYCYIGMPVFVNPR